MKSIDTIRSLFSKLNVLIVGDVMIDRYWQGKVNRISPEAPVPIVEFLTAEDRLGGAANVALNIKALGATAHLWSVVGSDTEGGVLLDLMTKSQLSTQGIMQSNDRITTVKTRIMAGNQQILRVDNERATDLNAKETTHFIHLFDNFLKTQKIDVIILQDYNKGVLNKKMIKNILQNAQKRQIPTAVDPKRKNFFEYRNATLFKPNLKEIRDAVGFTVMPNIDSLRHVEKYIRERLNNQLIMVTLSDKGLYYATTEGGQIYPTQQRLVADVSGAGDTVISVAALGLAAGLSADIIARLSNLAGGQVCEAAGVVPVDMPRLIREYQLAYEVE